MKLGIGTYCYMWAIGFNFGGKEALPAHPMTALGLLQRAVELGVHLVQYGPNLALSALGRPELEELIACARQWNVELEVGTRGLEPETQPETGCTPVPMRTGKARQGRNESKAARDRRRRIEC